MTFSDKIKSQKQKLISTTYTEITNSLIRGDAQDDAIRMLSGKISAFESAAERLALRESARFANLAQTTAFQDLGVEQYQILGSTDKKMCGACEANNGKVFKLTECKEGETAPPFHPNCRCTKVGFAHNPK